MLRLLGLLILLQQMIDKVYAAEELWLPGATGSGPAQVLGAWITAFRVQYPEARLTISSVGSGSAQKALWGDIDCVDRPVDDICSQDKVQQTVWGMGDAPIDRKWYAPHADLQLQQLPACAGAVAIVYGREGLNEDVTGPLRLDFETLSGMLNQTILYWDDDAIVKLNPSHELPRERISAVVRSDSSGQTSIITDALDYQVASWPDEAVGKKPDWPLGNLTDPLKFSRKAEKCVDQDIDEESVTKTQHYEGAGKRGMSLGMIRVPYSLGYMEVGYADSLSDFLSRARLGSSETGFVEASSESLQLTMGGLADQLDPETLELNLARADTPPGGYPVAGYAYFYLKRNEAAYESCYHAWMLCQFVKWCFTDPKAAILAEQNGWVVPPQVVVNVTLSRLEQVMCTDTEASPPRVIPALSYVPIAYREVAQEESNLLLVLLIVAIVVVILAALAFREAEKRRQSQTDVVWKVGKEELKFDSPITVIGQGSFGQIVLAEYRGTRVAVKRLIPPTGTSEKAGNVSNSTGVNKSTDLEKGASQHGSQDVSIDAVFSIGATTFWTGSSKRSSGKMDQHLFVEEMRIISKIRHPCIATVMGAVLERGTAPMLVMEYMEHGSLYDILHNETMVLDGDLILPMLQDIVQGIRFLHTANPKVIHGDLKSKNILVDQRFRAKVADFGISAKYEDGGAGGTPYWTAPEILMKESKNTVESDIYSFGIILYEVFARKTPYDGEDFSKTLRQVCDPLVQKRPEVPFGMPLDIQNIMKECLRHDPTARPDAGELDSRLRRINENEEMVSGASQYSAVKPRTTTASLFDLFPRNVAEALRDGRKVQPQHKECVTLFFSDVVDFTNLSAQMHPHKVANLLDRLYNVFDELSRKFDVYKVETIGDSYMAVANLVKNQDRDHVKRIALFAIEAVKAANETPIDPDDPSLGNVQIRVGFHSGPVVADVVGTRSPRYCLFGDTVNTASRMESKSLPDRIQCSRKSFTMLRRQCPELEISMRGRIDIKGKESMITYFIVDSAKNKSLEAKFDESSASADNEGDNDDSNGMGGNSDHTSRTNRSGRTTHTITGLNDDRSTHSTHSDFLNFLRDGIAEDSDEDELVKSFRD